MRIFVLVGMFCLISASTSFADVAAYCEAYAIDFANLSEKDDVQWQARREDALAACLLQYRDAPAVVKTKRSKPATVAQKKPAKPIVKDLPAEQKRPELKEGSPEWYDYCARKYTSFDRKSGNYLSKTGIERKCLVTADFE
jgi:BA14K-like protein